MAQSKKSNRRVIELIIFAVIIICVGLVLVELATNVMAELSNESAVLLQLVG